MTKKVLAPIIHFVWVNTREVPFLYQDNMIDCKENNQNATVVFWYNKLSYNCFSRLCRYGIVPLNLDFVIRRKNIVNKAYFTQGKLKSWTFLIKQGNYVGITSGRSFGARSPAGVKDSIVRDILMEFYGGIYFDLDIMVSNLNFDKYHYTADSKYIELDNFSVVVGFSYNEKQNKNTVYRKYHDLINYYQASKDQGGSYEGRAPRFGFEKLFKYNDGIGDNAEYSLNAISNKLKFPKRKYKAIPTYLPKIRDSRFIDMNYNAYNQRGNIFISTPPERLVYDSFQNFFHQLSYLHCMYENPIDRKCVFTLAFNNKYIPKIKWF